MKRNISKAIDLGNLDEEVIKPMFLKEEVAPSLANIHSVPLEKLQSQHHAKQTYFLLYPCALQQSDCLQLLDCGTRTLHNHLISVLTSATYEKHSDRMLMTIAIKHLLQQ